MTTEASGSVAAGSAKGGRRGSLLWVQGLACGALLTFAAPTALLLTVLFAPAVVCLLAETGSTRGLVRAVGLACGAAALGPVWRLWLGGDGMDQALATLSNPATILLAWGGGAAAWASCQILPVLLRSFWDLRAAARRRAIEAELEHHRSTWNLDDLV